MRKIVLLLSFTLFFSCNKQQKENTRQLNQNVITKKIKVLNFGTFHFGYTPDANKTEFDENDKKQQEEVKKIATMLAKFKPTIICVEVEPNKIEKINQAYQEFLQNPIKVNTNYGEISMLAFNVAQSSGVQKLYGIDHKLNYNYMIGEQVKNTIDPSTYNDYRQNPFRYNERLAQKHKEYENLSFSEKMKFNNEPEYLDFLININADNLLYVGTEDDFEGANEASLFYLRNLRIYSNLNRIPMTENDRVFILMGGAHTAFLREIIKRSPKFEMVNTFDYLK